MERVESLIKRLLELHESRADESAMLLTAQMLVQELQQNSKAEAVNKKVSVIHPAFKNIIVRNAGC
jgi:predicted metal-dependent enzyme (double-stranded beta helix superfamily)